MKKLLIALLSLLITSQVFALSEEDLLPPDQAFSVNVRAIDANTVEVEWTAADKYYMYNDKFNFKSETPGIELGKIILPPGEKKFGVRPDGTEGELEVYRGKLALKVPLIRSGDSKTLSITVGSQGCADLGVCYPPAQHTVLLNLPDAAASSGIQKLSSLGNSLLGGQVEFLAPDQAFSYSASFDSNGNIVANWVIAEGYYLYKDKFSFSTDTAGVQLGKIELPKGKMHFGILPDGTEGDVEVYMQSLSIVIPVDNAPAAGTLSFTAQYQGCADAGICYPPATKKTDLPLSNNIATKPSATFTTPDSAATTKSGAQENSYLWYVLIAFVVGLGLTFTPCVLPMIPILSSIIVGQSTDGKITKFKGGMLSFSYVLGTSVIYTLAGYFAGESGGQLQAYFQNVWLIGGVSLILIVLALSMFGLFTIQMPAAIQSRMQSQSAGLKGGSLFGVFIMGILSSMIVGACASPILLSVLLVAVESQDPILGALIMFSMSWGMGAILIAIGIGAGSIIPKAGMWMDKVKYFFGVLLIAVSIHIVTVLPDVPVLLLWGIFFITLAVYMGATQSLPDEANGWRTFWKGIGTVLLIWGVLSIVGGIQGNRDIMKPVDFNAIGISYSPSTSGGASPSDSENSIFTKVASIADLDRELANAKAAGKPVIIDFYAIWCTDCLRMEKSTFSDANVRKLMGQFVALKVDVEDPTNPGTSAVQKKLGVFGPPAVLFFDKQGQRLKNKDFYGYKDANEFAALLKEML